jgi:CO dehydrogenase maturation factor
MKIAITGKGGVGKSTISALIARVLRDADHKVLVIDADPDMNSATILGVPRENSITPIVELKELIAERTGTEVGRSSPIFKMNPRVDDIPEKYCVEHHGVKLLVMGTILKGGGGCACPENAFLKTLISHMVINRNEWVILDMEAGIEHLGRGTALGVDGMIVVVEPSQTSVETAERIKKLAGDIGIRKLYVAGNKVQADVEREFLTQELSRFEILGFLPYSEQIRRINMGEINAFTIGDESLRPVREMLSRLDPDFA